MKTSRVVGIVCALAVLFVGMRYQAASAPTGSVERPPAPAPTPHTTASPRRPSLAATFEGDHWLVHDGTTSIEVSLDAPWAPAPDGIPPEHLPTGTWCGGWTAELDDEYLLRRGHVLVVEHDHLHGLLLDTFEDLDFGRTEHAGVPHLQDGSLCIRGTDLEPIDPQDRQSLLRRLSTSVVDAKLTHQALPFPPDDEQVCWPLETTESGIVLELGDRRVSYRRCDVN